MEPDGSPNAAEAPEPRRLRNLRWMVTAMTATMILGILTIVALLVISVLGRAPQQGLPETVKIPEGERAEAFTRGGDWIAVVTRDTGGIERIRILDAGSGAERQVVVIGH